MKFNFSDNYEFEAFVRKIAKECWSTSGYSGPITVDGKERDGVLENETMIYCLEVTVSKTARHTLDACEKLDQLVRRLRGQHPDKGVTGWYITRFEPTGEQGAILQKYRTTVNHRTYDAFYSNMVDAKEYLIDRPKKPFGSIRHPKDGSFDAELKYTPTKIFNIKTGDYTHTGSIAKQVSKRPTRALIVGEFGAGKSMALRDVFQRLSSDYRSGNDSQFPVYINLRDHIEQYDPDECLRRHASSVGMASPEKLIKAWRSGLVYLLLDGFDELAPRIATTSKKRAQDLRNSAISLVRRLIDETPADSGILLVGRNNYFDTPQELHSALGVKENWMSLELHDLDEDDLSRFISDHGWEGGLPEWVPKKPLLISYVKQNNLLQPEQEGQSNDNFDPATGWNFLIDKICEREVGQVYIALEPSELRRIFGRLATFARKKTDRRGPLSFADCKRAFVEVTGVEPEERSVTAILRLPGMSGSLAGLDASDLERGSRFFVDPDLADALSAEDVLSAIKNPYEFDTQICEGSLHPLGELGCRLTHERLGSQANMMLSEALRIFSERTTDAARNISSDLLSIVFSNNVQVQQDVLFSNVYLSSLRLDSDADYSNVTLDCCAIETLTVDVEIANRLPILQGCQIETLMAPEYVFEKVCEAIEAHNQIDQKVREDVNFDTLRQEGAPESFLDLVSIIDKVFVQSRKGRLTTAIFRGRPPERRESIERVLNEMSRADWVRKSRKNGVEIIVPNLSKMATAKMVIAKKRFDHRFAAVAEV